MEIMPVFQEKYGVGVWKTLETGSWRTEDQFIEWLDVILKHSGTVDSHILVKAIQIVDERKCSRRKELIKDLVSKRRPEDCMPPLTAAMIFLNMNDIDSAKEMESKVKTGNIPLMCCVRAKIAITEGDPSKAKKELTRARCSDPTYAMFYELIETIDPTGGWMYRRNIELLVSGKEPIPCGSTDLKGMAERLYAIYHDWYRGLRDDATRAMVSSEEYRNKNPEFLLASARMSIDERDWHSAQMMYDGILASKPNCVYILCEAADSYFRDKNYDRALALYRDAEALDPCSYAVVKGLIQTYYACGMTDEAVQCIVGYLDTEDVELSSYKQCARLLYDWENYNESLKVVSRILTIYPTDMETNILSSKIQVGKGNYNAALDIASEILRKNQGESACRIQYANVLFTMGKVDRAEKETEKVLRSEPDNVGALLLMMSILSVKKDNEGVVQTCKKILNVDPMNEEASGVMAKTLILSSKVKDGTNIESTIHVDVGPKNLMDLASSLITESRYKEAIDVCDEYEKRYGSNLKVKKLKGNAEYCSGEYLKASAAYASAAAMDPIDPIIWHSKGMADEKIGDLDSAEEAFNKAVLMDLNEPEFWISCSSVQEKKGDLTGAVESLNRVIELSPDSSYALVKKGMIFASMGKFEESLYFLKLAYMTDEGNKDILKVERDIYLAASMDDKLINISERIICMDPKDAETVGILAKKYISRGEKARATSIVENAVIRDPHSIPMLLEKKEILTELGDILGAINVCEAILSIQSDNRMIKMDLIDLYTKVGDINSANSLSLEMQGTVKNKEKATMECKVMGASDGESSYQIARSLLKAGDIQGSTRIIERALTSDPLNVKYILLRSEIYEKAGDPRSADAFLSEVISKDGSLPDICEADGDLKYRMGDPNGASVCYNSALKGGKETSIVYSKLGLMQEKLGNYASAINNFTSAVIKDPKNSDAYKHLTACQLIIGNLQAAEKSIETLYVSDRSAMTISLRAKVFAEKKDVSEVQAMYDQYLKCTDKGQQSQDIMVKAMDSVGLKQDANNLSQHVKTKEVVKSTVPDKVPDAVKRYSERVLRRAYTSGLPLSDSDLVAALDIEKDMVNSILRYLSDMSEYGDILPGTPEFDRMETLSMNAITKGDCNDLENDPVIPIPCAFVAGGTKDSDEAKLLVAYIYKVMKTKTDKRVLNDIRVTSVVTKDMTVEEIVKTMHIGIYHAKAFKENL
jgi:tetratricopeptide (TPR) repeat protein